MHPLPRPHQWGEGSPVTSSFLLTPRSRVGPRHCCRGHALVTELEEGKVGPSVPSDPKQAGAGPTGGGGGVDRCLTPGPLPGWLPGALVCHTCRRIAVPAPRCLASVGEERGCALSWTARVGSCCQGGAPASAWPGGAQELGAAVCTIITVERAGGWGLHRGDVHRPGKPGSPLAGPKLTCSPSTSIGLTVI